MNDDRERELRRLRSTLRSLALGTIAFGMWSIVKTSLFVILTPFEKFLNEEQMAIFTQPQTRFLSYIFVALLVLVVMSIDVVPRFYIGLKARKEGLGIDKGRIWVIWAFILLVGWCALLLWECMNFKYLIEHGNGMLDTIVSLILDLGATIILGELCFTAVRLKKLVREGS